MVNIRPDWTKQHFKHDAKLDLSFNVCVDRYVNYHFDVSHFCESSQCYNTLAEYHEVSPYNIAIGFGISDLMNRVVQICARYNWELTVLGNAWKAVEGYKNAYKVASSRNKSDVVYIASHNGNDGSVVAPEVVNKLCDDYQWVCLDEAYADFYPMTYVERPNLLRFKTMTKSLPLPGARFGWMRGDRMFIKEVQDMRDANHCIGGIDVNLPSMLAEIPFHVERMIETKHLIETEYECFISHGNYVLLKDFQRLNNTIHTRENRMALCDKETWYEYRPNQKD